MSVTREIIMKIKAQADASGKVAWEDVRRELEGVDKAGAGAEKRFSGLRSVLSNSLAIYGAAGVAFVVARKALLAFAEDEQASLKLASSLSRLGITSMESVAGLEAEAKALSRVTMFKDDDITSTMAMLATMGVARDRIGEATRMALNLASAFDKDLHGAAMTVGKVLAGETTAGLARYGVVIDETISKQDQMAQAMQFFTTLAGRAEDAAKSTAGEIASIGKAWDDLMKGMGKGLAETGVTGFLSGQMRQAADFWSMQGPKQQANDAWQAQALAIKQAYLLTGLITDEERETLAIFEEQERLLLEAAGLEKESIRLADQRKALEKSMAEDAKRRAAEAKAEKEAQKRADDEIYDRAVRAVEFERKKHADKMRDMAKELDAALKGYGMMDAAERSEVRAMQSRLQGPGGREYFAGLGSDARGLAERSGFLGRTMAGFAAQTTREEMGTALQEIIVRPTMNIDVELSASDLAEQFIEKVLPKVKEFTQQGGDAAMQSLRAALEDRAIWGEYGG